MLQFDENDKVVFINNIVINIESMAPYLNVGNTLFLQMNWGKIEFPRKSKA